MSEANGAADAAAATATPAQNTGNGSSGQVDTKPASGADQPFINKAEFVEHAKLLRSLKEEVASLRGSRTPAKETKGPSESDRIAALEFRAVVAEKAPHLTSDQRARLSKLYALERPEDPEQWVAGEVAALGWVKAANAAATTAQAPPPAQAKQATHAGAPGVGGRDIDTNTLTREDWLALDGEELRKAWKARVASDPTAGNTFAPRSKP